MPRNTDDWSPKDKRTFGTGSISYVQAHQRWQSRLKGALDIYASTKGKTRAAYKEVEAKLNFIVEKRRQTGLNREYRYTDATVLEYARLHINRPWGKKMKPLSPATVKSRLATLRTLENDGVGFVQINMLRVKHIDAVAANLQAKGISSWANVVTFLKSLCNFAARNQDINRETNPAIEVCSAGKKKRKGTIWSEEEATRFLKAVAHEPLFGPLLRVMYETGLRIGEVHALRNCDVFLDADMPHLKVVQSAITKAEEGGFVFQPIPEEDKAHRTIYLYPESIRVLREYVARKTAWTAPTDFFWNGQPTARKSRTILTGEITQNRVRDAIGKYSKLAGVPRIRAHDFRHTHLSGLINSGSSIKAVQIRGGHASGQTTIDTYVHSTDADQRALVAKMSSIAAPGTPK